MQVKITVENFEKLRLACQVVSAEILKSTRYGKKSVVILAVKKASDLYELGRVEESLTVGDVVTEFEKEIKEKISNIPLDDKEIINKKRKANNADPEN